MDYAHARHAGNAADVVKHVALLALVEALVADVSPLLYVETHAGDGVYPLASVGEWGAGAQRLWDEKEGLLGRYARIVHAFSAPLARRPERYPGSPLIVAAALRARDRLLLHEIDPRSAGVLRRALQDDPRATVRETDGFDALSSAVSARSLALIDPPYSQKAEWTEAARSLAAARGSAPEATFALWYPIKALTRPRALLAELPRAGVHGLAVELHWTPLRLQRERLNGCGMVLVNAPRAAAESICASLVHLGPVLQTHGEWHATQIGF